MIGATTFTTSMTSGIGGGRVWPSLTVVLSTR
ncbi:hypothetical protein LINPERHAP2_LOCUS34961 [Linum perenne]